MPAWDSLSDNQKRVYARQMEVYAGYGENADWNIGRIVDAIEEMGELDNTLVIYIWGDNGASMEGSLTGTFNEFTMMNGIPLTDEQQLQLVLKWGGLDAWGGELMAPHYSAAWAWASNCPFQWGKQVASHLGGTRDPMVVRWPQRITEQGGLRTQFTHVIDIGPTILEAAGIPEPTHIDGVEQKPMHGTSLLYSLDDANAPERHTQQYFEILGNRGDVQGRLVALVDDAPHPVEGGPRDAEGVRTRGLGSRERSGRAVLPARRLHPGTRPLGRASGKGGRAQGALLAGGRGEQRAAPARRPHDLLLP